MDLPSIYQQLLSKNINPLLLLTLVVDRQLLLDETSWGKKLLCALEGHCIEDIVSAAQADLLYNMQLLEDGEVPVYNPFLLWRTDHVVENVPGVKVHNRGALTASEKDSILQSLSETTAKSVGIIYPFFAQIVRHVVPMDTQNEGARKNINNTQRSFQLHTDPMQGLYSYAQLAIIPKSDHLSSVEWPVVDQGIRKFYIDWERLLSSLPEGVSAEQLRELALQTPALICEMLQSAECITEETEITVLVKEATRSVKTSVKDAKSKERSYVYDTKVSMHFIFQISLTYSQYEQVWALIEKCVSEQPHSDTIFQCISNNSRMTVAELQTMGKYGTMCGVDFSSRNNLMQVSLN
jgi:hypothetical protein